MAPRAVKGKVPTIDERYAVFALSTLGLDDWFIRKAIELVPELHADLGGLLSPLSAVNADAGANAIKVGQGPGSIYFGNSALVRPHQRTGGVDRRCERSNILAARACNRVNSGSSTGGCSSAPQQDLVLTVRNPGQCLTA